MKLWKIIFINMILFFYGFILLFFIIKPQGFFMEFIKNYQQIKTIKNKERKVINKTNYLKYLIKNYKNKDKLITNYILYEKFNYLTNEYEEYK